MLRVEKCTRCLEALKFRVRRNFGNVLFRNAFYYYRDKETDLQFYYNHKTGYLESQKKGMAVFTLPGRKLQGEQ